MFILAFFNLNKEIRIKINSLNYIIKVILNYKIYNKKLLIIINAF